MSKIDTPWKHASSHGNWREDRAETIRRSELRLLHTVAFILGLSYITLLATEKESTVYGWGILLSFSAFCTAILIRFIKDLTTGEL